MKHEGYYFNPNSAGFLAGSAFACLDHYQVELEQPVWEAAGELFLSAPDFKRFLAMLPDGNTPPALPPAESYALSAVWETLGCPVRRDGNLLQVLLTPKGEFPPSEAALPAIGQEKGRPGDYFGTYWHVPMGRFAPYRLYLPQSYQPQGKNRLLLCLHGGGGSPDSVFDRTQGRLKDYAERDGYILAAPDGSTFNSTYGCAIPPNGMKGAQTEIADPANPENLTPEELRSVQMGELGLDQMMALLRREYALDEEHLYLMGNSMGGMGTLYYASRHPGEFRKISAQGAIPDMRFFDCSGLAGQPTLFVAGELDSHGVEHLRDGCRVLEQKGVPVTYREVPGGTHSSAWVDVLEEIFDFFLRD